MICGIILIAVLKKNISRKDMTLERRGMVELVAWMTATQLWSGPSAGRYSRVKRAPVAQTKVVPRVQRP